MEEENPDIYLELDSEDYGILAVYGNALLEGFESPAYTKDHVSNFIGKEVGEKMDIFEAVGYLERYQHSNWNDDVYKLVEEAEDGAKGVMKNIDRNYDGDIPEFINESDREELANLDASMSRDQ